MTDTTTAVDTTVRLTETEALLALMVEHLDKRLQIALGACGQLITELAQHGIRSDLLAMLHRDIYSEGIEMDAEHTIPNVAMPVPPIPARWLGEMARSGRSIAQVAGSRREATQRIERALGRNEGSRMI